MRRDLYTRSQLSYGRIASPCSWVNWLQVTVGNGTISLARAFYAGAGRRAFTIIPRIHYSPQRLHLDVSSSLVEAA